VSVAPRAPAGLREHVALAERTTLEVGGAARWLVEPEGEVAVGLALAWAREVGARVVVLGGGSNVLVADRGLDALVVCPRLRGVELAPDGDRVLVRAGAGERFDALVERAVGAGLAGLEALSGIPGDVGGAPIQNVGAYGQEVAETIVEVRAIERATGDAVLFDRAACGFAYRDSVFKRDAADAFVVVEVTFALRPNGAPAVRYPELARALGPSPTLVDVRRAVLELRRTKSMVVDPADENHRSAGSFFTNPTLDAGALAAVRARAGDDLPTYPADGGRTKLSAAWLIEHAGFPRGTHDGRVGLSTKHALALVNRGGATAAELVAFASRVRAGVRERFGVALAPEPALLGFDHAEIAALRGEAREAPR
jgi:UDP-N-acetylmuramate dehydrogenase